MTLRRAIIRTIDRPGGRWLLGRAVTYSARKEAPGVRVCFRDGMWVHESNGRVFVDSPALDYRAGIFRGWKNEYDRCREDARDHWFYAYKPRMGDVIVDVGAGKGEDVITFSEAVGPSGRVFAIEAHPVTFRCLQMFCALNGLDNVRPLNHAVVDIPGAVAIGSLEGWQGNTIGTGSLTTEGVTLDELVAREEIGRIDLLKVNIEGAEREALGGMSKSLAITQALCISCHDFRAETGEGEHFRTKSLVHDFIRGAGFRIISRDSDARPYVADQVNGVRAD